MIPCPVCRFSYDPPASGGACPRCALAGALTAAAGREPIEDFEFVAELGRGAMGTVSLARQRSLDRLVALKVIAAGSRPAEWLEARLLREARASAQLQHPHIVAVHEVGHGPAGAFLAMEYCEGGDLRARLREKPLSARAAAELGAKLADAMVHAHAAGVLHRDLKPSNVLLTAAGEPKISDFGLTASTAGSGAGEFTQPGEVAGSPSYLAPETLSDSARPAPAVDIYGLGAILYEGVTGRPPFTGDTAASVFAQIVSAEPAAPRVLNRDIPADLETIILKCLRKKPAERYATAAALRDDLRAFLEGRPIAARPLSAAGRLARWARRKPGLAAALAVILLGTLGGSLLLAERNRELAAALAQSEQANATARLALRDSLLAQARAIRESGRQGQRHEALALIQRAAKLDPSGAELTTEALAALALDDWQWIRRLPPLLQLRSRHSVGFDADLRHAVVPGMDGSSVAVIDLANGRVMRQATAASQAELLRTHFGPVEGWILAQYQDGTQAIWGPGDVAARWRHRTEKPDYNGFCLSSDARSWWFTTNGSQLMRHDATSGEDEPLGGPGTMIYGITLSPDGRQLAVVRDDRLEVWDLPGRRLQWSALGDVGSVMAEWTPDGRHVIGERYAGSPEIAVWNAADGNLIQTLRSSRVRTRDLAVHPDGRRLFAVDSDSILRIWDLNSGRELVRGPSGRHGLRIGRDGRRVAASADFQTLGLLDLAPLDILRPMTLGAGTGTRWQFAALSPDGRWLVGLKKSSVWFFDTTTGREVFGHDLAHGDAGALAFLPDGRMVYSSSSLGLRRMRPVEAAHGLTWAEDTEIFPPGSQWLLALSPDGRSWITEQPDPEAMFLWPEGNPAAAVPIGPAARNPVVQISPDGRWAAFTASLLPFAAIHSLPDGRLHAKLPVTGPALGEFSPDGQWLVLGTNTGYDVWRLADAARPVHRLDFPQPGAFYGYSAFSPDGRHLAYMTGLSTIALARPGHWRPELTFTLPYGMQRDEWVWARDSGKLYIFSGNNEVTVLHPAAATGALRELGLRPANP